MGYLKRPKTHNEAKLYFDAIDQDIKPRAKRCPKGLANAWDDKIKACYHHKCWKRHRVTQYK